MLNNPVSCHLITWGQHFDQALREVEELGFHACEPFPKDALVYEQHPEEFRALLASYHLRLSALYGGGRFGDPAQREKIIAFNTRLARFLASIGVDRLVFGPGGPRTPACHPERSEGSEEELREAAKTINEAARACYDLGVLACVHPHLGTEIEIESEIDTIMELTDPRYVYFCPDTAHLTGAEIDVPRMIRRYGERMRYMHIKDLRAGVIEERRAQKTGVQVVSGAERLPIFCELGRGIIDYNPIMDALQDVGYNDWITVEIDISLTTPKESLAICRDYLLDKLGLRL